MKKLSLNELRAKQAEISATIAAAERAEREKIGAHVQELTGLDTWGDIEKNYKIVPIMDNQKE